MNVNLHAALWSLPGSQRFLARAVNALENGKSLWVLFPPNMTLWSFEKVLLDTLKDQYFEILDLQGCDTYTEMQILARAFPHLEIDEGWPLERIVREPSGPRYILIRNFESLVHESRHRWAQTVSSWGEIARRYSVERSLCIFTVADAATNFESLLTQDVRLQVERWYAVLSTSELGLLCRLADDRASLPALWRQYLLPSLSGGDVALIERLWDTIFGPMDELTHTLYDYALEQGWDAKKEQFAANGWRPTPPLVQPVLRQHSITLWNQGWLTHTPENGEELHTALLSVLGKDSEIRHRLWRGQAALLLPLIDSVRVLICERLVASHGEDWPRIAGRTDVDAYAELGVLEIILRNTPQLEREKGQWLETIVQARLLRNAIAHYTPVAFEDFARFWKLGIKVHQQLRR